MASYSQLFVTASVITIVYGQPFNVTSKSEDYFLISQRSLLHEIDIAELQIAAIDARYSNRLDAIQYKHQWVLHEIQQANQALVPLQALSLDRKYCIQKYHEQLLSYNVAKERFTDCYNNAKLAEIMLTQYAKSTVNAARYYTNVQLPGYVDSCNKYSEDLTKLELCYVEYVQTAVATIQQFLKTAKDQWERSLYDAHGFTVTAVECSFEVEKDAIGTLSSTAKEIEYCVRDYRKDGT